MFLFISNKLNKLFLQFSEMVMPDFMYKTLGELGIGTLCKIATVNYLVKLVNVNAIGMCE